MLRKGFSAEIKNLTDEGTGEAVIATLGVVDKDGDFTEPGAFGKQLAKLAGAHDWGAPTIGIAEIEERGSDVVAKFRFNLSMPSAVEWHQAVKFNSEHGVKQEWSYGYDILESGEKEIDGERIRLLKDLRAHEVSPVMIGAGIGTRTLEVKAGSLPLGEEFARLIDLIEAFEQRAKSLTDLRTTQGRNHPISLTNVDRLKALATRLTTLQDELSGLLRRGEQPKDLDDAWLELSRIEGLYHNGKESGYDLQQGTG